MQKRKTWITRHFLTAILLLLSLHPLFSQSPYDSGYPRWLKSGNYTPDQTSGIAFLGERSGASEFLIADDIGKIHRLFISADTNFTMRSVEFSGKAAEFLQTLPKPDFEEIVYDRFNGKIFLSIEGNLPSTARDVGIYELIFTGGNAFSDTITEIRKLDIQPAADFLKFTDNNIGFEGVTVLKNYIVAGLEGFSTGTDFADSTIIYFIDRRTLKIEAAVSTKQAGIHTICGLCALDANTLLVLDRNQRKLFKVTISMDFQISVDSALDLPPSIPGYPGREYVFAPESVACDAQGNIYIIDDPWRKFYVPRGEKLNGLSEATIQNFKNYIPVIYRLKLSTLNKEH